MSYFITSISNAGGGSDQSYKKLQKAGASPEANFSGKSSSPMYIYLFISRRHCKLIDIFIFTEIFKLEAPSLMVGTLDSLMVREAHNYFRVFQICNSFFLLLNFELYVSFLYLSLGFK